MNDEVVDLSGLKNVDWSKISLPQSVQGVVSNKQQYFELELQRKKDEQESIDNEKLRLRILEDFSNNSSSSNNTDDKSFISNDILIYGAVGVGVLVLVVLLLKKK